MRVKDSVMSQLQDFQAWSKTGAVPGAFSLLDYVGFIATPDSLFGFAELFSPEVIVYQGYRFLASGFSTETYQAWALEGKSPQQIQRVMNHVHISMLLQNQEINDETAIEAARVIATVWSKTLGPSGLAVEMIGSNYANAAITFFEERDVPKGPSQHVKES